MAIPPDLSLVLRWVETERGLGYLAMRWSAVVSDARAKPLMPFGGLNTALRVEQLRRLVQGLGYGGRIATELSELLINADAALVTREQRRGRGASP
ncbi:MAG: hypothetical protein JOZ46_01375 [Candidatus Dormibacteraeota bacterium]|nr:hypothetical protein [Candidatus Dormibacteraeota bacterium]MBV9524445.1 hypothetical protein [Candidatus Dormibacteraeota bacterium]